MLELRPDPGLMTDVLQRVAPRLTAVQVDTDLAAALSARLAGGLVVQGPIGLW